MKTLKEFIQPQILEYIKQRYGEEWYDAETKQYYPELDKEDLAKLTESALSIIDNAIDEELHAEYMDIRGDILEAEAESDERYRERMEYYYS